MVCREEIKIKQSAKTSDTNEMLLELFQDCENFDVKLLPMDDGEVLAHRLILVMFSPYLVKQIPDGYFDGIFMVPVNLNTEVTKNIVELMYCSVVKVLPGVKPSVTAGLSYLKVKLNQDQFAKVPLSFLEPPVDNNLPATYTPGKRDKRSTSMHAEIHFQEIVDESEATEDNTEQ